MSTISPGVAGDIVGARNNVLTAEPLLYSTRRVPKIQYRRLLSFSLTKFPSRTKVIIFNSLCLEMWSNTVLSV